MKFITFYDVKGPLTIFRNILFIGLVTQQDFVSFWQDHFMQSASFIANQKTIEICLLTFNVLA